MANIYKNKNFVKRDYECTNIVACDVLGSSAPLPEYYEEADETVLKGLNALYVQDNVRYYGYL